VILLEYAHRIGIWYKYYDYFKYHNNIKFFKNVDII
jgi:hypothetical protein